MDQEREPAVGQEAAWTVSFDSTATTLTDNHAVLCSVLVRLPLAVKEAVVAEAARRGSSANDVGVGILSAHFDVQFAPSGRRGKPNPAIDLLFLRLAPELKRHIQLRAIAAGGNTGSVVASVLAEELNVGVDLPKAYRRSPFGGGRRRAA
jgi:hypothetical protein